MTLIKSNIGKSKELKEKWFENLALEQTIFSESQSPLIQNICVIFWTCLGSLQISVFSNASHAIRYLRKCYFPSFFVNSFSHYVSITRAHYLDVYFTLSMLDHGWLQRHLMPKGKCIYCAFIDFLYKQVFINRFMMYSAYKLSETIHKHFSFWDFL